MKGHGMDAHDEPVKVERRGKVGVLTLDRPRTLNALDVPTLLRLEAALDELERDASSSRSKVCGSA